MNIEQALKKYIKELEGALELPILFYSASPWDDAKKFRWKQITGSEEANTKVMCDHIRKVTGQ